MTTLRELMRELRERGAVSPNQQEVMAVKTHWDCDKPALSFALAEGGEVGGVERDGATGASAAWLTILPVVDSFLFTPDFSEGIDLDGYNIVESDLEREGAGIFVQTLSYLLYKCGSGSA